MYGAAHFYDDDEGGAVDFVEGIWIPFVWNFQIPRGSRFAGERTAFDGAGADDVVGHEVPGRNGGGRGEIAFCNHPLTTARTPTEVLMEIKGTDRTKSEVWLRGEENRES